MTERPTVETRKFLMGVARRTVDNKDNYFFISAETGEIVSSGYLQGNGDNFPHTPSNTYCIGISKNLKFTYKQLDELIDSSISLYEEEKHNQEVFDEATEILKKRIHFKGRGKNGEASNKPICPQCEQDLKRSYETAEDWKKGKTPYGWHCRKCKYQQWD